LIEKKDIKYASYHFRGQRADLRITSIEGGMFNYIPFNAALIRLQTGFIDERHGG
jgi:hypothetical protein